VEQIADLPYPARRDEDAEMLAAIDEGVAQLDQGLGIPIEAVEKRLEEWLSK
jgi:hypothetical protein